MTPRVRIAASEDQIQALANFILAEVSGEPSQSQGAVDTAIRLIRSLQAEATRLRAVVESANECYRLWDTDVTDESTIALAFAFDALKAALDAARGPVDLATACALPVEAEAAHLRAVVESARQTLEEISAHGGDPAMEAEQMRRAARVTLATLDAAQGTA